MLAAAGSLYSLLQFAESGGYHNFQQTFPTGIQQLADERAEEERKAKENEEKKAEAEWFWYVSVF